MVVLYGVCGLTKFGYLTLPPTRWWGSATRRSDNHTLEKYKRYCYSDRKSDLKMAAVAYELQNPPTDVKVFYQSKPASSVLQRKLLRKSLLRNFMPILLRADDRATSAG